MGIGPCVLPGGTVTGVTGVTVPASGPPKEAWRNFWCEEAVEVARFKYRKQCGDESGNVGSYELTRIGIMLAGLGQGSKTCSTRWSVGDS